MHSIGVHRRDGIPLCTICVQRRPRWTAILLRGELDMAGTEQLVACAEAELARDRPVLLELGALDFCDLAGLKVLARFVGDWAESEGPVGVEVHGARGQVRALMQRTGTLETIDPVAEMTVDGNELSLAT